MVQVGWQGRADRYTYLPEIGLYIAVTWEVTDLTAVYRHQRAILSTAAILVIGVLSLCAWVQTSYWRDSETLFRHALAVTTNNDVAETTSASSFWEKVSWMRPSRSYKRPWISGQTIALPMRILPRLFSKKVKWPRR